MGSYSSAHTITQKKLDTAAVKKISAEGGSVKSQPALAEASQEMVQDTVRQREGGRCWIGADQSVVVDRELQSRHRSKSKFPGDVLRAGSQGGVALHEDDECSSLSWVDEEQFRLELGHKVWEGAADVAVSRCFRLPQDLDPHWLSEFESDLEPVQSPNGVDTWTAALSQTVASSDSEAIDIDAKWLDHVIGQTHTPRLQTDQEASKTAPDDATDLFPRKGPGCNANNR